MSLGTIHPNLYKGISKDTKDSIKVENKSLSAKPVFFILSFLVLTSILVSSVFAAHASLVAVSDGTDRINKTGATGVIWRINVTNQAGSTDTIRIVNITNATAYAVTNANATGNTSDVCQLNANSVNCTGLNIAPGGQLLINLTVIMPGTAVSGERTWTVVTQDSAGANASNNVYTAAIDNTDIAFDILDELGNITTGATVDLRNGTGGIQFNGASGSHTDSDSNGLILVESGNVTGQGSAPDTFTYNVSLQGFIDRNGTSVLYDTSSSNNGYKPSGLQYGIKVTVRDQLTNVLTGATVNITDLPISASNLIDAASTITPNQTSNNIQYFALPATFNNVTIMVTRSGFLNNQTFVNETVTTPVNETTQATGNSSYDLIYTLKVTVQDELGSGTPFTVLSGTTSFFKNGTTSISPNQTSSNVAYFSLPSSPLNLSVNRSGWINTTVVEFGLNATTQAAITPQLPYVLKLNISDERGNNVTMDYNATMIVQFNGTTTARSTTNSSQQNVYYFALDPASNGIVNITVNKTGYVWNNTYTGATAVLINGTTQASLNTLLPFTIRVTDICNTIGGPGHCYSIDGSTSFVEVSTNVANTTYSDGDAYINATEGSVTLQAGKNGYVNVSKVIVANSSTQTTVAFNTSGVTGTLVNASSLPFTIRVVSIYDELGGRNASSGLNSSSLGASQRGYGVDLLTQATNVFFNTTEGQAYINATGTSSIAVVAFLANQSLVNSTVSITPTATVQRTIIFNGSGSNTTDNGYGAYATGVGLQYPLKITVQDELSAITNMNSGVLFGFNTTSSGDSFTVTYIDTADAQVANVYYFANQSWIMPNETNITVARVGYINASSSSARLPINATNQTTTTIQLPFNLKVTANDELGQALGTVVNFTANGTAGAIPNSTSGANAYYALPISSVAGSSLFRINMSKSGYVDNATAVTPINTSTQATVSRNMLYTVRVFYVCDELNATCFTLNGNIATDGTAAAEVAGLATNYSAGVAYIPVPNMSAVTVTAAARGYVNTTSSSFGVSSSVRNGSVIFNVSSPTEVWSQINSSALPFTVRVQSICDELNATCFILNGSSNAVGAAGINVTSGGTSSSVNVTKYNTTSNITYIAVPGTSTVNLTAFSLGFINSTQAVTPTPGSAQVTINWNHSQYTMNYTAKITLQDELSATTNMNSGVSLNRNISAGAGTVLVENKTFFRSSPSSNVYYVNISTGNIATPGAANITAKRDGYVNQTTADFSANSSTQAEYTLSMPFAVKINTGSVKGVTATVVTGTTSFSAADGNSSTDVNSSRDGVIYWALNQTNVVGIGGANVDLTVSKTNYVPITFDDVSLNNSGQLAVTPTMVRTSADDTVAPVITLTSPAAAANATSTTPTITFTVIDNTGGSGIEMTSIAVNNSAFNYTRDCTAYNDLNVSCSFTTSSLTDAANYTISIGANDNAGNLATNATRNFGVDTAAAVAATLNTSDVSAIADNTYNNGWSFTFNITLGSTSSNVTDVNATAVKIGNWTRVGGTETIITTGNTIMNYTDASGTARTYYVSHDYNTTDTIYPLQDSSAVTKPVNGTVTVYVKIPASTTPGTYTTTFTFGSWSVALTGGNPT